MGRKNPKLISERDAETGIEFRSSDEEDLEESINENNNASVAMQGTQNSIGEGTSK